MKCVFKGAATAICTPMDENGVKVETFRKLLNFQMNEGIDAILVLGTTGEPSTMNESEKETAIQVAVETVNKRVPLLIGTGGNNTAKVISDSRRAQRMGADALLIVTPYYNKTTQPGLVAHYTAVADAVDLPIIIYNVPGRTGLNMTADTLYKLSDHPNIAGMKEASGNISQVCEMGRLCSKKLALYSGNDDMIVPLMSVGGVGVISVISNIAPKFTHDMCAQYLAGNVEKARDMQFEMNPLVDVLFKEVNPIPVKTALKLMGFDMGQLRLPLVDASANVLTLLNQEMKKFGLL
ncbi:MAG: 4-hydroxy-tetrahydrodipicolinate synthase [Christensenellales bacterium]